MSNIFRKSCQRPCTFNRICTIYGSRSRSTGRVVLSIFELIKLYFVHKIRIDRIQYVLFGSTKDIEIFNALLVLTLVLPVNTLLVLNFCKEDFVFTHIHIYVYIKQTYVYIKHRYLKHTHIYL